MAHYFNPSTWEAEAGRFLNSKTAGSTEWVPWQQVLHRESLSQGTEKKKHLTKITREHSSWSELGAYIKKFFHEASEITHQTWACVKPFYHLWSSSQLQTLRPRNDHSNRTQRKIKLTSCYSGSLSVNQDIWSLKRPFWDRAEKGGIEKPPKDSNEIHLFVN